MIARLWWKEMRVIWPAWPILFAAAALIQWLILSVGVDAKDGGFVLIVALCWPVLHAFVVAAAAFAGERDNGTLGLLDALPVDRRTLWLGKASFALISTLGLVLAMIALGLLGLGGPRKLSLTEASSIAGQFATLLFEAVAWGLLWSALLRNPMIAGALALGSVGLVSTIAISPGRYAFADPDVIPARLVMAALALAASAILVSARPHARWLPGLLDGADRSAGDARPIRPRRSTSTRALMWKAARQGRPMMIAWSAWFAIVLANLLLRGPGWSSGPLVTLYLFLGIILSLVAGLGVFGDETAAGSHRFLLHLGVTPGRVWTRTLWPWFLALAAACLALPAGYWVDDLLHARPSIRPSLFRWLVSYVLLARMDGDIALAATFATLMDVFAVGTLAGMLFRRRITGGLIAVMACLVLIPPQFTMAMMGLLPPWSLFLTPPALLMISRAWAGDWLDERPGSGRWLRLLGYVAVPSVLFPIAFVAHRAWGIPDPGPVALAPLATSEVGGLPGTDTGLVYERLASEIDAFRRVPAASLGLSEKERATQPFAYALKASPDLMGRIDRASTELPPYRSARLARAGTAFTSELGVYKMTQVVLFLREHGWAALDAGDPAAAWRDVIAMFRMARQLSGGIPIGVQVAAALEIEREAIGLGLDWAKRSGADPEILRAALKDLQAVSPMPSFAEVLKAEGPILDRTFDLPGAEIEAAINGLTERSVMSRLVDAWLVYPWWERERARRSLRTAFAALIANPDDQQAWEQSEAIIRPYEPRTPRTSPMLVALTSYLWALPAQIARATTGRRALVQVIALRAWSLEHGGAEPGSLDVLVPGLLDRLPADPYSTTGLPFLYIKTNGRRVLPPRLQGLIANDQTVAVAAGRRLLISVGPDHRYDGDIDQVWRSSPPPAPDDLAFPVP